MAAVNDHNERQAPSRPSGRADLQSSRDACGNAPQTVSKSEKHPFTRQRRSTVAATLKLTHKAIGVEVRRGTYDVVVDGKRVGSAGTERDHRHTGRTRTSHPASPQRPKLQPNQDLRRRRGRNRQPSDAAERASCRSFSCPSSFPAWHSRSVASSQRCARSPLLLVSAVLGTAGRRRVDPSAGGGGTTSLDRRVPDRVALLDGWLTSGAKHPTGSKPGDMPAACGHGEPRRRRPPALPVDV